MENLFFLLSGEHPDLPASELKAILETENHAYKTTEKLDQVLRLKTNPDCIHTIKHRAALTRLCARELFTTDATINSIIKATNTAKLDQALGENETFAVRIKHIKNHAKNIDGLHLEKKLGELVLRNTQKTRVKLRNPDKTLIGILTDRRFVFGQKLAEIPAAPFVERRPRKKPFFHPSAMQAKLARCMINLAHAKQGDTLLDPFCGTGTTLIEAALIGCRPIGFDVQRRMTKGTLKNMKHYNLKPEGLIIADAKDPPINKIDRVVTDPPYGTSATTLKRTTKQIIQQMLAATYELLSKGNRACIAAPKKLNITQTVTNVGYKHLESHCVYVHRSLTREIVTLQKE